MNLNKKLKYFVYTTEIVVDRITVLWPKFGAETLKKVFSLSTKPELTMTVLVGRKHKIQLMSEN